MPCGIIKGDAVPLNNPPAKGCFTLWKPNFHIFPFLKEQENMRTAPNSNIFARNLRKQRSLIMSKTCIADLFWEIKGDGVPL